LSRQRDTHDELQSSLAADNFEFSVVAANSRIANSRNHLIADSSAAQLLLHR
jgi:hypothetical protein